ncbi:class I SAM-dependent methyltransferase [Bernardetia sp.]|uniref:class I SAM-dependent methyltransferase n=1 Tax=Bernardetia sp. TaxID=1937974 RepID=UPI0025C3AA5C|nr:class I SAM-dependent methyltransferase [Bernardetia sp.]
MFKTTEITAYTIPSDNVIHQRLLFAYYQTVKHVSGSILETGCGVGKGAELFKPHCTHYTALDKNQELINHLQKQHPEFTFLNQNIPPFANQADESFDTVVTQQVIEHIEDDNFYLKEIQRVLKKGGKMILTTPNIKLSLTRNPWHVREYTAQELQTLLEKYFSKVDLKGITGNEKIWEYYEQNKASVAKYKKLDVFNLEQNLPRQILQIPYDILNRMNRKKLQEQDNSLVSSVTMDDYFISDDADKCFDFFAVVEK